MAPELLLGEQYDWSVDVYAYGILVYATIFEQTPFGDNPHVSPLCFMNKVCAGLRPTIPPNADTNWVTLIHACWSGSPQDRPTMEEIVTVMATPAFIPENVDIDRFMDYQQKVVPPELYYRGDSSELTRTLPTVTKSRLDLLIEAADAGDPFSQNALGCRLRAGEGVKRDLPRAARYFKMAADQGNVEAMVNYGMALEGGSGLAQNMAMAAEYYERAMDAGDSWGMFCYADMLEFGKGVPKDEARAVQLFKLAADSGDAKAQSRYGMFAEFGKYGVPKSNLEAARYYKMASDQGSLEGMYNYADMLEYGKGIPKDTREAIRLYKLGASKGHPKSLAYLGVLMLRGALFQRDAENGKKLLNQVVDLGYTSIAAEFFLRVGVSLVRGDAGIVEDRRLGVECIDRAAKLGNKQASAVMAHLATGARI
jgi:TPR repeat protein